MNYYIGTYIYNLVVKKSYKFENTSQKFDIFKYNNNLKFSNCCIILLEYDTI